MIGICERQVISGMQIECQEDKDGNRGGAPIHWGLSEL